MRRQFPHMDKNVKEVRWPGWAKQKGGDSEVRQAIMSVLHRHGLPLSGDLFNRAYDYVAEHY